MRFTRARKTHESFHSQKLRQNGYTGFSLNFLFHFLFFFTVSNSDQLFHHTQVRTGLSKFGASTCALVVFANVGFRLARTHTHAGTRQDAKVLKSSSACVPLPNVVGFFLPSQKQRAQSLTQWHTIRRENFKTPLTCFTCFFFILFGCLSSGARFL